jgi:hypothetical protein
MISLAEHMWQLGKQARLDKDQAIKAAEQREFDSILKKIESVAMSGSSAFRTEEFIFEGVLIKLRQAGFKVEEHCRSDYTTISWEQK